MAALPNPFNPTEVEPMASFDVMPAGKYPMVFTESEVKPNSKGTGSYLQLVAEVIDGDFKGRKIWVRLNIENPTQSAVDIAKREMASICQAVGYNQELFDSAVLHNIPFMGDVKIEPANNGYEARNGMKGYAPMNGSATAPARQATAPTAPAPKTGSIPGWGQ